MRWTWCATVLLAMVLITPALAQTAARRGGVETPTTGSLPDDAAQKMNEQLARQERVGRRATSGICDGCTSGTRSGRHRVEPREIIGEDGLAYRAEDIRY